MVLSRSGCGGVCGFDCSVHFHPHLCPPVHVPCLFPSRPVCSRISRVSRVSSDCVFCPLLSLENYIDRVRPISAGPRGKLRAWSHIDLTLHPHGQHLSRRLESPSPGATLIPQSPCWASISITNRRLTLAPWSVRPISFPEADGCRVPQSCVWNLARCLIVLPDLHKISANTTHAGHSPPRYSHEDRIRSSLLVASGY